MPARLVYFQSGSEQSRNLYRQASQIICRKVQLSPVGAKKKNEKIRRQKELSVGGSLANYSYGFDMVVA